jgi:hypothetical protein
MRGSGLFKLDKGLRPSCRSEGRNPVQPQEIVKTIVGQLEPEPCIEGAFLSGSLVNENAAVILSHRAECPAFP